MTDFVTTSEAAEIIGCVDSRVRQLLRDKKLVGQRVGRDWLVSRKSAVAYRDSDRKPGPVPRPAAPRTRKRGGKSA
jgi:excisionase family DNA binding protein